MEIYIERENKTIDFEVEQNQKLIDILKQLDISIDSVIIVKNDNICLEDERVNDKDKIKILSVVSGG